MASRTKAAKRDKKAAAAETGASKPSLDVGGSFANDLPMPPVPKLLRALPHVRKFSRYFATSLELDDRPWVLPQSDPESRIELVDTDAFGSMPEPGAMRPPLKKEDAKLLQDYDLSEKQIAANKKRKELDELTEAFHREAFGLQLPQLLTNDLFVERQIYTTGTDSTEKKLDRKPPIRLENDDLTAQVERTFQAADEEPVHPTNPKLKVRRILPIVPDATIWANKYRQVVFDELPEKPKRTDLLYMTVPSPRVTCYQYFQKDDAVDDSYRLAQNYVWENRGGFSRQVATQEGESLLLSLPQDDEEGEARFVMVPPWVRLKKQNAFKLDLRDSLNTKFLKVTEKEPEGAEAKEEHDLMGVVTRDEGRATDTSDVAWIDGNWKILSTRNSSRAVSSGVPSARNATPPASPVQSPVNPSASPSQPPSPMPPL